MDLSNQGNKIIQHQVHFGIRSATIKKSWGYEFTFISSCQKRPPLLVAADA